MNIAQQLYDSFTKNTDPKIIIETAHEINKHFKCIWGQDPIDEVGEEFLYIIDAKQESFEWLILMMIHQLNGIGYNEYFTVLENRADSFSSEQCNWGKIVLEVIHPQMTSPFNGYCTDLIKVFDRVINSPHRTVREDTKDKTVDKSSHESMLATSEKGKKSFWNIFSIKKSAPKLYYENDNVGTRHNTVNLANSYWLARQTSSKKDPFIGYWFDNEKDARQSLLELPCIHIAEDSGNLICTEVLIFGYYKTDEGDYETIICGENLTHELWTKARTSFIKHGGRPAGQGGLEPEKSTVSNKKRTVSKTDKVTFVRDDRQQQMGSILIYHIYKGPDATTALDFLKQNPLTKKLHYIVVETPEGNYCRDIDGIYKE